MTISIWIILAVILAASFWFYFKKNKGTIQKPEKPIVKSNNKYALSNIDKMLENITTKETVEESEIKEKEMQLDNEEETSKEQIKKPFDVKKAVIESIILERKKK